LPPELRGSFRRQLLGQLPGASFSGLSFRGQFRGLGWVVAVGVPSGMDADTGQPVGDCVRADFTVTFVAEKTGFAAAEAKAYLGKVVTADIGLPQEAIAAGVGGGGAGGLTAGRLCGTMCGSTSTGFECPPTPGNATTPEM